jgi:hypothetical protein
VSALTLLVLRLAFLALLWVFIFAVIFALRSDLFGQRVRKLAVEPAPVTPPAFVAPIIAPVINPAISEANTEAFSLPLAGNDIGLSSKEASRLVIVSGPKEGLEMPLGREPLTIGRSSESGLVIRDDYTSTHHARLMLWSDSWVIQDLDSTNGTFLGGTRVTLPTPVPLNTPVRIGTTSFELRR